MDILRKPFTDLSNLQTQNSFLERVRDGSYFAVVLSPPCSTFSRAPWRNRRGPRPIRSYEYPDGLPGLRWAERRKARLGNILAHFSLRVAAAALDLQCSFVLLEHGRDPCSMMSWATRTLSMWSFIKLISALPTRSRHVSCFGPRKLYLLACAVGSRTLTPKVSTLDRCLVTPRRGPCSPLRRRPSAQPVLKSGPRLSASG